MHFYGRRLNLKRRRVRAREAFSGDALPPPTLPNADHPPYIPGSPIRALHVPLFGIFVSVGPPNSLSGEAPATFSPPQSLHVPWEVFFYLSGGATIVFFLFYLVSHTGDSSVFLFSATSEDV